MSGVKMVRSQNHQHYRHDSSRGKLQQELHASGKAEVSFVHYLQVVVGKANRAKGQNGENDHPDKTVGEISPQQCRNNDGNGDEHAAHGGRAGFLMMGAGTFLANVLANLKFTKLADDGGADDQAHEQSGQTGKCSAKGDITKNAKWRKVSKETLIKKPVEQYSSD